MLTTKDALFSIYTGLNDAMFMLVFPFIIFNDELDEKGIKSIKIKHIIINILFPLTIIDYVILFIVKFVINFVIGKEKILNRTVFKINKLK